MKILSQVGGAEGRYEVVARVIETSSINARVNTTQRRWPPAYLMTRGGSGSVLTPIVEGRVIGVLIPSTTASYLCSKHMERVEEREGTK